MIELFLQELLEDWRQGRLTQAELLEGWTASGFTLPQMIEVLLRMLQSQAQRIHVLERTKG